MIKYLGSKRELLPHIVQAVTGFEGVRSVLDPFSGTSRVGRALKSEGLRVIAGDHNAYAHTLALCYLQADRECWEGPATKLLEELGKVPGRPGYFTETFCIRSRFVHPKNGERIDGIREAIAGKGLHPELEAIALTSLLEAADRVDSTTGLQMAYLKKWARRAHNELTLRLPALVPRGRHGRCEAHLSEAHTLVERETADVAYLDPPYNQHSYLGNYHVWESLVRWDKPDVYGVACKRIDCRERRSDFNSKRRFFDAFKAIIDRIQTPRLVVSFSNEGFIARETLTELLQSRGTVSVIEMDYRRYVGAQIGIHNLRGERVGKVSHLRNTEYLFIVAPERTR